MKREFTVDSLRELQSLISKIQRKQWCGVTDWFGDRYYDVKHWFGTVGVYDPMKDVEKYHEEVLDRENTSYDQLSQIFEDVSNVDEMYSRSGGFSYGSISDALRSYQNYVQTLSDQIVAARNHVLSGGSISDFILTISLSFAMRTVDTDLHTSLNPIRFTADNFGNLSDNYKEQVIAQFEAANPEYKQLFEEVLSDPDLTDAEKRDIKFITYAAPEPYRSIYLEHIRNYTVNVDAELKGSFYRSADKTINLKDEDSTFREDPCSPYNTFFHESGHCIDYFEGRVVALSRHFSYNGKTLHEHLVDDTRQYVESIIDRDMPELTDAQKQELLRSLNLTDDASYSYEGSDDGMDRVMRRYRKRLIDTMDKDLRGDVNECASDVYGGVTNNAISGSWGHYPDRGEDPDAFSYWYSSSGTPSRKQESELWAEFYAAQMTRDEADLASIRKHFPNAYKAMEEMARQMAATTGGQR